MCLHRRRGAPDRGRVYSVQRRGQTRPYRVMHRLKWAGDTACDVSFITVEDLIVEARCLPIIKECGDNPFYGFEDLLRPVIRRTALDCLLLFLRVRLRKCRRLWLRCGRTLDGPKLFLQSSVKFLELLRQLLCCFLGRIDDVRCRRRSTTVASK